MYKILSRTGEEELFNTYEDLLLFLKSNSNILKNACHSFNDKRLEYDHFYEKETGMYKWEIKYYKRDFMIFDPDDRIMNIPILKKDCENIDGYYRKPRKDYTKIDEDWKKLWAFRKSRDPKPYRSYYRRIRTNQERKWNSATDHKKYVRPKRRPHYLDPWDIEARSSNRGYGWKQFKRERKQWMLNND